MSDLINKTDYSELIQKYSNILELINAGDNISNLAVVIDIGTKYIKEKHNDLNPDWKTWSLFYLLKKYLKNNVQNKFEINKIIDEFVIYYKLEYQNYNNELELYVSDFDRDYEFVYEKL